MTRRGLPARMGIVAYGLVAYGAFQVAFLSLILFVNRASLPFPIPGNAGRSFADALPVDVALVALFALQHTVMARTAFKRWWTRVVPAPMERSTFVFATVACLALLLVGWVPVAGHLWHVESGVARVLLFAIQGVGWAVLVGSTFSIDHWELFGVRQVIAQLRGTPLVDKAFRAPGLYRFVRHPMMLGMLLGLWVTPDMTWSRMILASCFTLYLLAGIRIEERDLVDSLGEEYRRYQETVPRILPRLRPIRRTLSPDY